MKKNVSLLALELHLGSSDPPRPEEEEAVEVNGWM